MVKPPVRPAIKIKKGSSDPIYKKGRDIAALLKNNLLRSKYEKDDLFKKSVHEDEFLLKDLKKNSSSAMSRFDKARSLRKLDEDAWTSDKYGRRIGARIYQSAERGVYGLLGGYGESLRQARRAGTRAESVVLQKDYFKRSIANFFEGSFGIVGEVWAMKIRNSISRIRSDNPDQAFIQVKNNFSNVASAIEDIQDSIQKQNKRIKQAFNRIDERTENIYKDFKKQLGLKSGAANDNFKDEIQDIKSAVNSSVTKVTTATAAITSLNSKYENISDRVERLELLVAQGKGGNDNNKPPTGGSSAAGTKKKSDNDDSGFGIGSAIGTGAGGAATYAFRRQIYRGAVRTAAAGQATKKWAIQRIVTLIEKYGIERFKGIIIRHIGRIGLVRLTTAAVVGATGIGLAISAILLAWDLYTLSALADEMENNVEENPDATSSSVPVTPATKRGRTWQGAKGSFSRGGSGADVYKKTSTNNTISNNYSSDIIDHKIYRSSVDHSNRRFMQHGALPEGFEFLEGNTGRLGHPAAVSATGAMPLGGSAYSSGSLPSGYSPTRYSGGSGGNSSPGEYAISGPTGSTTNYTPSSPSFPSPRESGGTKGSAHAPSVTDTDNTSTNSDNNVSLNGINRHQLAFIRGIGATETGFSQKEAYSEYLNKSHNNANVRKYGQSGADYGYYQTNELDVKDAIKRGVDPEIAKHLHGGGAGGKSTIEQQTLAMHEYLKVKYPKEYAAVASGRPEDLENARARMQGQWFGLKDRPDVARREFRKGHTKEDIFPGANTSTTKSTPATPSSTSTNKSTDNSPTDYYFDVNKGYSKEQIDALYAKHKDDPSKVIIGGNPENPEHAAMMKYAQSRGFKTHDYYIGRGEPAEGYGGGGKMSFPTDSAEIRKNIKDESVFGKGGTTVDKWYAGDWKKWNFAQANKADKAGRYSIEFDEFNSPNIDQVTSLMEFQKYRKDNNMNVKLSLKNIDPSQWPKIKAAIDAGKIDPSIFSKAAVAEEYMRPIVGDKAMAEMKKSMADYGITLNKTYNTHAYSSERSKGLPGAVPTGMKLGGGPAPGSNNRSTPGISPAEAAGIAPAYTTVPRIIDKSPITNTNAGNVIQKQSTDAAIRKLPIANKLDKALAYAAGQAGVQVEVHSGGQAGIGEGGPRIGSTRHDHGNAADIKLSVIEDGKKRYLDFTNPNDRAVFSKFVTAARAAGATGIGAGSEYMGNHTIHVGYGNEATWGSAAGGWLGDAFAKGKAASKDLNFPDNWKSAPVVAPITLSPEAQYEKETGKKSGVTIIGEKTPRETVEFQQWKRGKAAENEGLPAAPITPGNTNNVTPIQMPGDPPRPLDNVTTVNSPSNNEMESANDAYNQSQVDAAVAANNPIKMNKEAPLRVEESSREAPRGGQIDSGDDSGGVGGGGSSGPSGGGRYNPETRGAEPGSGPRGAGGRCFL